MSRLNAWRNSQTKLLPRSRAEDAWRRINEKPTEIVVLRNQGLLDPQIVRVEYSNTEVERPGSVGTTSKRDVVVFGVRGHPDEDVPDTDLRRGDRFTLSLGGPAIQYRVQDVIFTLGEVQVFLEAVS